MRWSTACVLIAAGVAGLLFAPVFGLTVLLLPVAAVMVVLFGVAELCRTTVWRPVLLAAAGLLTIIVFLPEPSALVPAITESWHRILRSTWPVRPDPVLVAFVPLLVVLAGVFGVELLRLRKPLLALVPSFVVVVVSQLYSASTPGVAVVAALGYVGVGATLCALARPGGAEAEQLRVPVLAVALGVAGLAVVAALPAPGPAYSVKQHQAASPAARVANPLDDIAHRLAHPGAPVFDVRGASGVDRWPLVVLDTFDGVTWSPGSRYRTFGSELGPAVPALSARRTATIELRDLGGHWLPSQTWPASVTGLAPMVEETQGSLWLRDGASGHYALSWWAPETTSDALAVAGVDPHAPGGLGAMGDVPAEVEDLASRAVHGLRPSFRAALVLESFLRKEYRLATGTDLPTGHGWPQLRRFLFETKRGTSEQFATAYVALARTLGIPARLVVGFRAPASGETVRNGDVLAWPEVAVDGVGWVPLDPSGTVEQSGGSAGLGVQAARAREQLPEPAQLRDAPVAPVKPGAPASRDFSLVPLAGGGLALVVIWFGGIPVLKVFRSWRRRRSPGNGAVLGAWLEVRDRMRARRVPVSDGMTPRDLVTVAGPRYPSTVDGLRALGAVMDAALWSGAVPDERFRVEAWAAVRAVRRGLRRK